MHVCLRAALLLLLPLQVWSAQLTLFTINDLSEVHPSEEGWGGLAELKSLLDEQQKTSEASLLALNGDFLSPSRLCLQTEGAHMVDLLNRLGVQLAAFGNHEFDFGDEVLKERIEESSFTWLGTNVLDETGQPFGGSLATAIREVGGRKIGLFGLCTPDTVQLSTPGPDVVFAPICETAREAVSHLRAQGAELIVALTHQSIEEDMQLAERVPQIDLILGGHNHIPMSVLLGKTLIFKAGHDGHYLGRIDVTIEDGSLTRSWQMLANRFGEPDAQMKEAIEMWERRAFDAQEQLAWTETTLEGRSSAVRSRETTLGNLVTDAMRAQMGADVALINGGLLHADRDIPAQSWITTGDLLSAIPFANRVVVIELSGARLWEALEHGVSGDGQLHSHFPQVSGLRLRYDPLRPTGQRLIEVFIQGAPIDMEGRYRVAVTSFIFKGGDGYAALSHGEQVGDIRPQGVHAVLKAYLKQWDTVAPRVEGRSTRSDLGQGAL